VGLVRESLIKKRTLRLRDVLRGLADRAKKRKNGAGRIAGRHTDRSKRKKTGELLKKRLSGQNGKASQSGQFSVTRVKTEEKKKAPRSEETGHQQPNSKYSYRRPRKKNPKKHNFRKKLNSPRSSMKQH